MRHASCIATIIGLLLILYLCYNNEQTINTNSWTGRLQPNVLLEPMKKELRKIFVRILTSNYLSEPIKGTTVNRLYRHSKDMFFAGKLS